MNIYEVEAPAVGLRIQEIRYRPSGQGNPRGREDMLESSGTEQLPEKRGRPAEVVLRRQGSPAGQQESLESRWGIESAVTEQGQGPGSLKGRLVMQGGSCRGHCEARGVIMAREPGWALGSGHTVGA